MRRRLAYTLLMLLVLAATVIVAWPGHSYATQDRDAIMAGSSREHWTGTDDLGRDRTIRVAAALLLGLAGAAAASAISTFIAGGVGTVAAFSPGPVAFGEICGHHERRLLQKYAPTSENHLHVFQRNTARPQNSVVVCCFCCLNCDGFTSLDPQNPGGLIDCYGPGVILKPEALSHGIDAGYDAGQVDNIADRNLLQFLDRIVREKQAVVMPRCPADSRK
jgi:hypothetical protein